MSGRERQRFAADELAVVLSHYDLGIIESITSFERGSRRSPKVGIVCDRGKYLLKKRALEKSRLNRIRFAHGVQKHLAERSFPLPELIATRDTQETILALAEDMYELFAFIPGHEYGSTAKQSENAGRTLGRFHDALFDFPIPDDAATGTYHDVIGVRTALNAIPSSISSHESAVGRDAEILGLINIIFEQYDEAADTAEGLGVSRFSPSVVHADWHPGNMLFKRDDVAAVIDYDSCRVAQRVIDVANGMLQFSIIGGGHPDEWPDHADEDRLRAFTSGYLSETTLSDAERQTLPHLMVEAMIAESVLPVANTGSFGHLPGFGFLRMISRKAAWTIDNADGIISMATV